VLSVGAAFLQEVVRRAAVREAAVPQQRQAAGQLAGVQAGEDRQTRPRRQEDGQEGVDQAAGGQLQLPREGVQRAAGPEEAGRRERPLLLLRREEGIRQGEGPREAVLQEVVLQQRHRPVEASGAWTAERGEVSSRP
jgi:hypothetical protein